MPEFNLNTNKHLSFSDFESGYLQAMFFTNGDTGDKNENRLNDLGIKRLTRSAIASIKADCSAFLSLIMRDGCFVQQWLDRATDGYDATQAGRDLWFTRQDHGCGYWDREELSAGDIQDVLTDAATNFGCADVFVQSGWIYHEGKF